MFGVVKTLCHQVFRSLPFSSNFKLEDRIGEGTFSTVYLASRRDKDVKAMCAWIISIQGSSRSSYIFLSTASTSERFDYFFDDIEKVV